MDVDLGPLAHNDAGQSLADRRAKLETVPAAPETRIVALNACLSAHQRVPVTGNSVDGSPSAIKLRVSQRGGFA